MAITATLLTTLDAGWDTGADTGYTTASITPGANCGLVALMYGIYDSAVAQGLFLPNGSTTNFTIVSSGSGPTWTTPTGTATSTPSNGFDPSTAVRVAAIAGSDPGSFTVTVDFPDGRAAGQFLIAIYKVTGHDSAGTPYAGTIANTRAGGTGNGAQSITLGATPATADVVLALSGCDTAAQSDAVFDNTARTWTRNATGGASGHQIGYAVGQSTGSTSTTVAWSDVNEDDGNNFASAQCAIIVKVAAGGSDATATPSIVTATAAVLAATAAGHVAASPTVVTATASVPAPSVTAGGSANPTPSVVAASVAVVAPSVSVGSTVTATVVTATATVVAPSVSTGTTLYPASISGRKLLDQNGDVYLARPFSSWKLVNKLSDADITTALESVAANGFNGVTVWTGGIEDRAAEGDQYENQAGQPFWTGTPWASSLGAAWSSVDHAIAECDRLGLVYHFSFCAGFSTEGCGPDWEAATNTNMYDAGVAIATRYASATNIVWHIMFDDATTTGSTRGQRIQSLFDGINDTEGASTRIVRWCENNNGDTTDDAGWYQAGNFNATINCAYDYSPNSATVIEGVHAQTAGPIGDCEPVYSGAGHYGGNEDQQIRERNYAVFLEGGCLINFGHEDWWPFGGAGLFTDGEDWDTVQTDDEPVQASYAWAFLDTYVATTGWDATSSFVTTGEGTTDAKAAQGTDGVTAIAYFPNNRTVEVDTTIINGAGNVSLRWFDPVANSFSSIASSEAQQTGRSVTLPAARGDGTRDFLLVVQASDATATPSVVTATAAVVAPTASASVAITATVVTATTAAFTPTASASSTVTATVVTATCTVPAPTVTAGGSANPTPTVVTATAGVVAPTVAVGVTVTPSVVTAVAAVVAPTASGSVTITATVVTATASVPTPSISAGGSAAVSATVVTATAAPVTPAIAAGVTVTATVVTAAVAVLAAAVTVGLLAADTYKSRVWREGGSSRHYRERSIGTYDS